MTIDVFGATCLTTMTLDVFGELVLQLTIDVFGELVLQLHQTRLLS
jgi:hypothetical protein